MKRIILLKLFVLVSVFAFSQRETEKWYFPGPHIPNVSPALDFSSGVPVYLNNSAIGAGSNESSATISDATGNLLFYVDGSRRIFNRNHVIMPNGNNVFMHNSVTQGSIFVPRPGNPNIYYLFHIGSTSGSSGPPYNLYYSEIDLTLNGGLGDVTANKNIPIATGTNNCSEKMTATKHCNGTDYWLLTHDYTGTTYKAYLITAAGVTVAPVISNIGTAFIIGTSGDDAMGQMKFSPSGTKVASAFYDQQFVELFDFNKNTGVLSNPLNLGVVGVYCYGVEFSPDNSKLYATKGASPATLVQWDLCAGASAAVIASKTVIATTNAFSLQLAPNNRIYGVKFSTSSLDVINNPNNAGAACGYVANAVSIAPSTAYIGLPNFITSYFDNPNNYSLATVSQTNATACLNNGSAVVSICNVFGTAPYTYTWSTSFVDGPTTNLSSSISNLAPGNYNVIITDATCIRDTVNIVITGQSNIYDTVNAVVCIGTNYTLPGGNTVNTAGTYLDTLLSVNGCDSIITTYLSTTSVINVSMFDTICSGESYTLPGGNVVSSAGTYNDTLLTSGGCDSVITTALFLNPISVTISSDVTIQYGSSTVLSASGGGTYNWFPSTGLDNANTNTVNASPTQTTTYCVEVTSINGCKDSACVTVYVEEPCPDINNLNLPNAFSPNGDNINDEFCLQSWTPCNEEFHIMIFDRWGEKIFESKDPNFCWTGKNKTTICDSQVFVYFIKAKFHNVNSVINKTGNISLIR